MVISQVNRFAEIRHDGEAFFVIEHYPQHTLALDESGEERAFESATDVELV